MEKRTSLLRRERERRGWSRNYVAEQVGVDVMTVGRWERGERMPHPHHRQKLCTLFEKDALDLGFYSEDASVASDREAAIQEFDANGGQVAAISESESDRDQTTNVYSSLERQITDTSAGMEERPLLAPSIDDKTRRPSFFARRRALLSLGGLGIATLIGGGVFWYAYPSSPPAHHLSGPTPTLQRGQRFYHLVDPNLNNWVNRIAWSADNRKLAAANGRNVVTIWSLDSSGTLMKYYPTANQWVNDVSWSKDDWLAAVSADFQGGSLYIWHMTEEKPVLTLKRPYAFRTVAWSPDARYLACAGHATTVEIWDRSTRRLSQVYSYPQLGKLGLNRLHWSATGEMLACAADDGTIHLWEALTGARKAIYHKHAGKVHDLAWSPDARYIASGGDDKTVQIWDAQTGRNMFVYQGHKNVIEGLDWSPQGKYIASGSNDQTLHIWDAQTGKHITSPQQFRSSLEGVSWSPDGSLIASATDEEGIMIWRSPR